jgi:hypothetical protein
MAMTIPITVVLLCGGLCGPDPLDPAALGLPAHAAA